MFRRRHHHGGDPGSGGGYELRVQVLHAGTRSEGRVGHLYRDGREVRGTRPGETVVGPHGTVYEFLGDERPHLWSVSGWMERAPEPG